MSLVSFLEAFCVEIVIVYLNDFERNKVVIKLS